MLVYQRVYYVFWDISMLKSVQVDVGLIRQQKLRPEEAQEFETQFRSMIFYGIFYGSGDFW